MNMPPIEIFDGQWPQYEDLLYDIFLQTVVRGGLTFNGLPVKTQYRPETNNKGFSFWRLISQGDSEDDRTPDFRRCERIRWIAWVIENVGGNEGICCWENKRGNKTHVVLWCEEEQFAVVLAKRTGYYLIKTAYIVKPNRERSFRKERDKFLRS
jgi:hypothetical protein